MKKLSVIGMDADREQIVKRLMKLGTVHIVDLQQGEGQKKLGLNSYAETESGRLISLEDKLARIAAAIRYLAQFGTAKKTLFPSKRIVESSVLSQTLNSQEELFGVVYALDKYEADLQELRAEQNSLESLNLALEPWKPFDLPLETEATLNTAVILGTLPAYCDMELTEKQLSGQVPESYIQIVSSDREQFYIAAIVFRQYEEHLVELIKNIGFSRSSFKELNGTAISIIERNSARIREICSKRDTVTGELKKLAGKREELELLYDCILVQKDELKAAEKLLKTDSTFFLEGWVPYYAADSIKNEITAKWISIAAVKDAESEEEYPVLLRNNSFVKPFELVTELYSLPDSRGIDPNFFMAPFFCLFFGLMVGDAGYGIVMTIGAAYVLLKFRPQGMADKLIKLIMFGGISTFFWGSLFGGWFGDTVSAVTGGKYTIPALWFNPLDNPMKLLIWSFVFGGVHIFTGMGLQAYKLVRKGKYLDALFDIGSWYLVLIGLALLVPGGSIAAVGKYMAITGAVLLVLTQGRNEKSIIKKIMTGVLSLYNITGYMSDVLSYSRLLALGLATGVIANVVNTMGTLFGLNPVGIVVLVVAFVAGHAFNIAINTLGAYVHSSRLQYVEFFGKFYEGGGKAFKPLKIDTKYVELKDKEAF